MWYEFCKMFFSVPIRNYNCKFFTHYLPNNLPTTDFFSLGSSVDPKAFAISLAISAADACGCATDGADAPLGFDSTYVFTIL